MQTLGDILRAEREKQGASFKDVEKATSIRALYIQAIEEGNYSILPGEVYLKGFIRNYANFLGLNGQEMVDLYRQSQQPEPVAPAEPAKKERKKREKGDSGSGSKKWLIAAVVVLLLGGAAGLALFSLNSPAPIAPPPTPQTQSRQPLQPTPPAPATPQTPQGTQAPAPPAARAVVIGAKYTEPAWTLVTADGKTVYEGIPKVGETFTWSADRSITIRLGNARGVDITYNGQPQAKLGGDGEVIEKTYSAGAAATNIQKQ